jgi:hypothetical protein
MHPLLHRNRMIVANEILVQRSQYRLHNAHIRPGNAGQRQREGVTILWVRASDAQRVTINRSGVKET